MYSGNTYPNYLSGTAYVMSIDVAQRLYNVSLTTPIFHLEDVYLTGSYPQRTIFLVIKIVLTIHFTRTRNLRRSRSHQTDQPSAVQLHRLQGTLRAPRYDQQASADCRRNAHRLRVCHRSDDQLLPSGSHDSLAQAEGERVGL